MSLLNTHSPLHTLNIGFFISTNLMLKFKFLLLISFFDKPTFSSKSAILRNQFFNACFKISQTFTLGQRETIILGIMVLGIIIFNRSCFCLYLINL